MCLPHDPFTTTPSDLNAKTPLEKHKAMVMYMDSILGKMIKALEDEGLRKNTLIIWTDTPYLFATSFCRISIYPEKSNESVYRYLQIA